MKEHLIPDVGVDRVHTKKGRTCVCCDEHIARGEMYVHINKNGHLYTLCGKCTILIAMEMSEYSGVRYLNKPDSKASVTVHNSYYCECCEEKGGRPAIEMVRSRVRTFICHKCFNPYAEKVAEENPLSKADVVAELL